MIPVEKIIMLVEAEYKSRENMLQVLYENRESIPILNEIRIFITRVKWAYCCPEIYLLFFKNTK